MLKKRNIDKIKSKMTLYGFKSLYDSHVCKNKMELDEYLNLKKENGSPDIFFGTKFIIDYIGEYDDRSDVIRIKYNKNKSQLINIVDSNSYEIYNKKHWKMNHGDVTYVYNEFAKRGIKFENYSYELDKTKVLKR